MPRNARTWPRRCWTKTDYHGVVDGRPRPPYHGVCKRTGGVKTTPLAAVLVSPQPSPAGLAGEESVRFPSKPARILTRMRVGSLQAVLDNPNHGGDRFRRCRSCTNSAAEVASDFSNRGKPRNANDVSVAMCDIDAEYEALCAEYDAALV